MTSAKELLRQVCPPLAWRALSAAKRIANQTRRARTVRGDPSATQQDLEIYWDAEFASALETWGIGSVWREIEFLASGWTGRVLDVGCGTGKTMEVLKRFSNIEVYGIDISDFLVKKALERGIPADRVRVADATALSFGDGEFEFAYSIGSLEHFTEAGIEQCISECSRVTRGSAFHMVPVSRSGADEGWLKTSQQSYFNNSIDWWMRRMSTSYANVIVLDSSWSGERSIGKWLIGLRNAKVEGRSAT